MATGRYFDSVNQVTVVQVFQGEFRVSADPAVMFTTVLGSCVAACLRDPAAGVGGMNHFLLPSISPREGGERLLESVALRYGGFAMDSLISALLEAGAQRDRLEVKVVGGANVLPGLGEVGHRNADFVEAYLADAGLKVTASQLRGTAPRKLQYFPVSGVVRVRELKDHDNRAVAEAEIGRYRGSL